MATLEELKGLETNEVLRNKVQAALWKWANTVFSQPTPDAKERELAVRIIKERGTNIADSLYRAVLGANAGSTVAQITSASDTAIETATISAAEQVAAALQIAGSEYV